jgi:hypothetical protein
VLSGGERYVLDQPSIGDACRLWVSPLYSRIWGFEVATNLASKMVVDLAVTRHRRDFASLWIDIDGVPAAFAMKLAAIRF